MENKFVLVGVDDWLPFLADDHPWVMSGTLSLNLALEILKLWSFEFGFWVIRITDNSLDEFFQFLHIQFFLWILPDIRFVQKISFVGFIVHTSFIVCMDNVIVIVFFDCDFYTFIAFWKSQQLRYIELCNKFLIFHHVINLSDYIWTGLIEVNVKLENVGLRWQLWRNWRKNEFFLNLFCWNYCVGFVRYLKLFLWFVDKVVVCRGNQVNFIWLDAWFIQT